MFLGNFDLKFSQNATVTVKINAPYIAPARTIVMEMWLPVHRQTKIAAMFELEHKLNQTLVQHPKSCCYSFVDSRLVFGLLIKNPLIKICVRSGSRRIQQRLWVQLESELFTPGRSFQLLIVVVPGAGQYKNWITIWLNAQGLGSIPVCEQD